ncbi:MAG: four helix bundle protein [Thermomicrobiales bacterium]
MDPELFGLTVGSEEEKEGGIRESRPAYNTDLAENDLVAWKNAIDLAVVVYDVTERWPNSENLRTLESSASGCSIGPANIAEGQGRNGKKEFLRFLYISMGSLREVETLLVVARRVGLLDEAAFDKVAKSCLQARKPLRGLINHLEKGVTTQ